MFVIGTNELKDKILSLEERIGTLNLRAFKVQSSGFMEIDPSNIVYQPIGQAFFQRFVGRANTTPVFSAALTNLLLFLSGNSLEQSDVWDPFHFLGRPSPEAAAKPWTDLRLNAALKLEHVRICYPLATPPGFFPMISALKDLRILEAEFMSINLNECEEFVSGCLEDTDSTFESITLEINDLEDFTLEDRVCMATAIIRGLKKNTNKEVPVRNLCIKGWLLDDEAILSIFGEAMGEIKTLTSLPAPEKLKNTDAAQIIRTREKLNTYNVSKHLLDGNWFEQSEFKWTEAILEFGDEIDPLFCLLKENPGPWLNAMVGNITRVL